MRARVSALREAVADVEKKLKNQRSLALSYDIFARTEERLDFEIHQQRLLRQTTASETTLALRLLHDDRLGFAFTQSLAPPHLTRLIEKARASLQSCDRQPGLTLGKPTSLTRTKKEIDLFDASLQRIPFAEKLDALKRFERDIFSTSKHTQDTDGTSWTETTDYTLLVNRDGLNLQAAETTLAVGAEAISRRGKANASYAHAQHVRFFSDLRLQRLARHISQQAALGLGAQAPRTGRFPVVLDAPVVSELLEAMVPSFYGDEVFHRRSFFVGKLGQPVFSPLLSIVDDGRIPRAWGSCLFDGEGIASQRTPVVEAGHLVRFLEDSNSARKNRTRSSGNSRRETPESLPHVGHSNFFIENGTTSQTDLLLELRPGVLLTKIMGVHLANTLTGDFALGGSGFWVENGRIVKPIGDFTVSGNFFEMAKNLRGLGADLQIDAGFGSPSWLVPPLNFAGT